LITVHSQGKISALMATSRVANLPSVVCNGWVGVMIHHHFVGPGTATSWINWAEISVAGICLYVAGNFLNDWMDLNWDRQHRPERALPCGLFAPLTYLSVAILLGFAGIAAAFSAHWLAGIAALGILLCVVIYTIWHKRSPWMVIPMGLCRGLLPIMGVLGMGSGDIHSESLTDMIQVAGLAGGALFCYIVGLSLSARGEATLVRSDFSNKLSIVCFWMTALMIIPILVGSGVAGVWSVAATPYLAWVLICQTRYRRPIGKYVAALLAGIPLVDWMVLLPLAFAAATVGNSAIAARPAVIISLVLPPLAFILARALQRLAPAT